MMESRGCDIHYYFTQQILIVPAFAVPVENAILL